MIYWAPVGAKKIWTRFIEPQTFVWKEKQEMICSFTQIHFIIHKDSWKRYSFKIREKDYGMFFLIVSSLWSRNRRFSLLDIVLKHKKYPFEFVMVDGVYSCTSGCNVVYLKILEYWQE